MANYPGYLDSVGLGSKWHSVGRLNRIHRPSYTIGVLSSSPELGKWKQAFHCLFELKSPAWHWSICHPKVHENAWFRILKFQKISRLLSSDPYGRKGDPPCTHLLHGLGPCMGGLAPLALLSNPPSNHDSLKQLGSVLPLPRHRQYWKSPVVTRKTRVLRADSL